MLKFDRCLALLILTTACSNSLKLGAETTGAAGTSSGTVATGTTGAAATTATQGASTSGHAATPNTGTATGTTSGATASTTAAGTTSGVAATSGASGGGFTCPAGFGYVGGNCVSQSCTGIGTDTPCELPDAGLGFCYFGTCEAVDLDTNNNCGGLGVICASDTPCLGGICTGPGGAGSACGAGACPTGTICQGSTCVYGPTCPSAPINAGCYTSTAATEAGNCCAGACVPQTQLASDPQNCGTCGNVCPSGSICTNSACVPTSCTADSALGATCFLPDGGTENLGGEGNAACCGGACVDLTKDPSNCGSCGLFCPNGETCQNGTCATHCQANSDCGSAGACVDTGCFPTACAAGNSNTACGIIVSSTTVVAGSCCNGTCASFYSDPQNCGACGISCGSGVCIEGTCQAAPTNCADQPGALCSIGASQGQCCNGTCTLYDNANCGGCGIICPTDATCTSIGGVPVCAVGTQQTGCSSSTQCGSGQTCVPNGQGSGICVSNTCTLETSGAPCGLPGGGEGTCCGTTCSDLISDTQNCQSCGQVCPVGDTCQGAEESDGPLANCIAPGGDDSPDYCSAQTVCPAGYLCETDNDACTVVSCAAQAEGARCVFGISGGIQGQFTASVIDGQCCGGQCVGAEDPNNCGGCGIVCPSGECVVSPFGSIACAPQPEGTCPQTCGLGTACLAGNCQAVTCSSPFSAFCPAQDGNVGVCSSVDGGYTCLDVTSDPLNCGAIGSACPTGQTCAKGICSGNPAPCDVPGSIGGFCSDAGIGWNCCQGTGCADLDTDNQNCGSCGTVCPSGQTCTQGTCG